MDLQQKLLSLKEAEEFATLLKNKKEKEGWQKEQLRYRQEKIS